MGGVINEVQSSSLCAGCHEQNQALIPGDELDVAKFPVDFVHNAYSGGWPAHSIMKQRLVDLPYA